MTVQGMTKRETELLADSIREYYASEQEYKRLEEHRSYLNKLIKQIMKMRQRDEVLVDDLAATLRTQPRRTLSKERVLAKLRAAGVPEEEIGELFDEKEVDYLAVTRIGEDR